MRGSLSKLTSTSLIIGLVLANVLLPVRSVSAAWTYEQLFNALTLGVLAGQDSWTNSGSGPFTVQADRVYEGAQAVKFTDKANGSAAADYRRSITAISDGSFYFAWNSSSTAATNTDFELRNQAASVVARIRMPGHLYGSNVTISNAANSVVLATVTGTLANDTWYPMNVEFNDSTQPDKVRARIYITGAWGSFTPWVPIDAYTTIDSIRWQSSTGDGSPAGTIYFDSFSATDITTLVGGGGTPTPALLQSVGGGVILFDHLTIF